MDQELIALEEQGWRALSSGAFEANEFYEPLLDERSLMIFSGGMLVSGKNQILATMDAKPWQWYELEHQQVLPLSDDTYAVIYRVEAQREGEESYEALISSIYVRQGDRWKLLLHQQSAI